MKKWYRLQIFNLKVLGEARAFRDDVSYPFCAGRLRYAHRATIASQEDDKQSAINVVLAYEQAGQANDFDNADSLNTPDARVIEESHPHPFEPAERRDWQAYKDASLHVDYHAVDAVADVRGNVAWVTVTLHSVWTADTPAGRAMLGGSASRGTWVESFNLVKTPAGWKIAFRHTSVLPPDGTPAVLRALIIISAVKNKKRRHPVRHRR